MTQDCRSHRSLSLLLENSDLVSLVEERDYVPAAPRILAAVDLFCKIIELSGTELPKIIEGMEGSDEFAMQVFDSVARKRGVMKEEQTKEELKDFWEQLSDQGFDNRLRTFFHMADKDSDGRITAEEVKEIIALSASANKLSRIKEQADEYTALVMEELDPDNLGYIEGLQFRLCS